MTITTNPYDDFVARVREVYATTPRVLFETNANDADSLYQTYLEALPAEWTQHHTCNTCRAFFRRYAGLVWVDPTTGTTVPAMWPHDSSTVPDFYQKANTAIFQRVSHATITGVLCTNSTPWGTAQTAEWTHFSVVPQRVHQTVRQGLKEPHEIAAERAEDARMLRQALNDFPLILAKQALALVQSDQLYRTATVQGIAAWFVKLHEQLSSVRGIRWQNLVWLAVATAPAGFAHIRSSVFGTLLTDLQDGLGIYGIEGIKARFAEKLAPDRYRRAQAAPSEGAVAVAERLFQELNLTPALARRYAQLSELPKTAFLWTPQTTVGSPASTFGHLHTKQSRPAAASPVSAAGSMTWEKFQRTILPMAERIEAKVPTQGDRFMALVTAADIAAPALLQWDREESRNPFSWYYAGGIDAEIRRRLVREGGRFENLDIRFSLMWNNYNDLDIHVFTPRNEHIYYSAKTACRYGGFLDVDMNAGAGTTNEPVENVRWTKGQAPVGTYKVFANLYTTHRGCPRETPFTMEIEVGGQVVTRYGTVRRVNSGNRIADMEEVASFLYQPGVPLNLASERPTGLTTTNGWGLTPNTWVPVTAVVQSPNLWGTPQRDSHGPHAFVLLEGCRDTQDGLGRGFYTEMLKSTLQPVRSVLEAYTATAEITGKDQATACGLGLSPTGTGALALRVTSLGTVSTYTIDRWD
jgi:hypothetical protein